MPSREKFFAFFVASFDASIFLLPMIFRRSGWLVSALILFAAHAWQVTTSVMIHDCIRLMTGNHRMRLQGIDIE
jgi:hypothetical protein